MFTQYFVTNEIAVMLKGTGFDEPCMASLEQYEYDDKLYSEIRIQYSNKPIDPSLYNDAIKEQLVRRPGLFEQRFRNSETQPWIYMVPIYQQVFEWLLTKGYYLHDYRVQGVILETGPYWGVNIFDHEGNLLWPQIAISDNFFETVKIYQHENQKSAWIQAILYILEIIKSNNHDR